LGRGGVDVGSVELLIQLAQLAYVLHLDTRGVFGYASAAPPRGGMCSCLHATGAHLPSALHLSSALPMLSASPRSLVLSWRV
jgi:hypothetical protein